MGHGGADNGGADRGVEGHGVEGHGAADSAAVARGKVARGGGAEVVVASWLVELQLSTEHSTLGRPFIYIRNSI